MGIAFAALGTAYADRPVVGLMLSALLPLAAWPLVRRFLANSDAQTALQTPQTEVSVVDLATESPPLAD